MPHCINPGQINLQRRAFTTFQFLCICIIIYNIINYYVSYKSYNPSEISCFCDQYNITSLSDFISRNYYADVRYDIDSG